MEEQWKDAVGFEGRYQVSDAGGVRSVLFDKVRVLKPAKNSQRYPQVILSKNGKAIGVRVHRMVALAFIPNPSKLPEVNHLDSNRANNRVENLEWCTPRRNHAHKWERLTGKNSWGARSSPQIAERIRAVYRRGVLNRSALSAIYGTTRCMMSDILNKRLYKNNHAY